LLDFLYEEYYDARIHEHQIYVSNLAVNLLEINREANKPSTGCCPSVRHVNSLHNSVTLCMCAYFHSSIIHCVLTYQIENPCDFKLSLNSKEVKPILMKNDLPACFLFRRNLFIFMKSFEFCAGWFAGGVIEFAALCCLVACLVARGQYITSCNNMPFEINIVFNHLK